ncbi:MAG: dCTP deaminase [Stellaceae bacterium]
MVLSQPDIRGAVERGEIRFEPTLEERQWGEASVDLRLGLAFTKLKDAPSATFSLAKGIGVIAETGLWHEETLKIKNKFGKRETVVLDPGEFILAQTYERIWVPNHLIGLVEGRSTYARVGLSMHQTAPWIQPGWNGKITLEIRNSGPLRIELTPIDDMPCQLTFFQLTTELDISEAYGSRATDIFQGQTAAMPARKNE